MTSADLTVMIAEMGRDDPRRPVLSFGGNLIHDLMQRHWYTDEGAWNIGN